jgi:hypothetical protein
MRLAAVLAALVPATALAQPAPDLAPPGLTPSAPPAPLDLARDRDAAADRGLVLGTAIALPSGAVDASVRAVATAGMVSLAVGLGSGLEVSFDAGAVFAPSDATAQAYGGSAKLVIVRRAQWALAVDASLQRYTTSTMTGHVVGTGSAMATGCMGAGCFVLATAASGVTVLNDGDSLLAPFVAGGLLVGRSWFRGIAEGAAGPGIGAVGFAGVRIGGKHFALDAGMGVVAPESHSAPPPLPAVGLSLRP